MAETPQAPSAFVAAPANGQVVLSWEVLFNEGDAISSYQYRYKLGALQKSDSWTTVPSSTKTATITSLSDGIYNFQVRSVSLSGMSAAAETTTTLPNTAPVFVGNPVLFTVDEGITAVAILEAKDTEVEDRSSITYAIKRGEADDNAQFSIDPLSGALTFNTAPDFENPTDLGADNFYLVTVLVTSGTGARRLSSADLDLTVRVRDSTSPPLNLVGKALSPTSVSLTWDASEEVSVVGYEYRYREVFASDASWTTPTVVLNRAGTTVTIESLSPRTPYVFSVRFIGPMAVFQPLSGPPQRRPTYSLWTLVQVATPPIPPSPHLNQQ